MWSLYFRLAINLGEFMTVLLVLPVAVISYNAISYIRHRDALIETAAACGKTSVSAQLKSYEKFDRLEDGAPLSGVMNIGQRLAEEHFRKGRFDADIFDKAVENANGNDYYPQFLSHNMPYDRFRFWRN